MSEARDLARAWIEIWGRGEPDNLPLADEFVHESPFGRIEGRERYLEIVRPMAKANVASLHIEQVIAEGDSACIAFTMDTPNGPIPCCDWVSVAGDRITAVRSYYDSRKLPQFEEY